MIVDAWALPEPQAQIVRKDDTACAPIRFRVPLEETWVLVEWASVALKADRPGGAQEGFGAQTILPQCLGPFEEGHPQLMLGLLCLLVCAGALGFSALARRHGCGLLALGFVSLFFCAPASGLSDGLLTLGLLALVLCLPLGVHSQRAFLGDADVGE